MHGQALFQAQSMNLKQRLPLLLHFLKPPLRQLSCLLPHDKRSLNLHCMCRQPSSTFSQIVLSLFPHHTDNPNVQDALVSATIGSTLERREEPAQLAHRSDPLLLPSSQCAHCGHHGTPNRYGSHLHGQSPTAPIGPSPVPPHIDQWVLRACCNMATSIHPSCPPKTTSVLFLSKPIAIFSMF